MHAWPYTALTSVTIITRNANLHSICLTHESIISRHVYSLVICCCKKMAMCNLEELLI